MKTAPIPQITDHILKKTALQHGEGLHSPIILVFFMNYLFKISEVGSEPNIVMTVSIPDLYIEYKKVSDTNLTEAQFQTLVMFFPSLLVLAADGVIDEEEWIYVKYLAKFISDTFKKDVTETELIGLNQAFYKNLEFLIDNLDTWEQRFLDSLKQHLVENPFKKPTVEETLHLFAEASDGESDEEAEKIEELMKRLDL